MMGPLICWEFGTTEIRIIWLRLGIQITHYVHFQGKHVGGISNVTSTKSSREAAEEYCFTLMFDYTDRQEK